MEAIKVVELGLCLRTGRMMPMMAQHTHNYITEKGAVHPLSSEFSISPRRINLFN